MERDFLKYNTYLCKALLHVMSCRKKDKNNCSYFLRIKQRMYVWNWNSCIEARYVPVLEHMEVR